MPLFKQENLFALTGDQSLSETVGLDFTWYTELGFEKANLYTETNGILFSMTETVGRRSWVRAKWGENYDYFSASWLDHLSLSLSRSFGLSFYRLGANNDVRINNSPCYNKSKWQCTLTHTLDSNCSTMNRVRSIVGRPTLDPESNETKVWSLLRFF